MPTKRRIYLSKSRFQNGRQCRKRLWLEVHRRDLIQVSDASQARFDEGNHFGELARELLGGGPAIEAGPLDAERAQAETRALLEQSVQQVPRIFEAAFEHDGVRIRADAVLRGAANNELVEVKSSTSVKGEYLWDCAVQAWVMRGAGLPLGRIHVGHVNNQFVLEREDDYSGLLIKVDVTGEVEPLIPEVPGIVGELKAVMKGNEPVIATGRHCGEPHPCPFTDYCKSQEPEEPDYPVSILPHGGKFVEQLKRDGFLDLRDVPEERLSNEKHIRVARASRNAEAIISPELVDALGALAFPRYYLDYETIGPVVPRWIGTKPFQQVPFQFSCHIEQADGSIGHREFLDISGDAPMQGLVDALISACGTTGPILVWSRSFEAGRTREMAAWFPHKAAALNAIVERMVDLLPIFRDFYYHPAQMGSWSIKKVLPTIAPELDYADLEVSNGGMAQQAWREAAHPDISPERKQQLRAAMLKYCERDTWAMVKLARWRPW